jgi:hypothetical protein
MNKIENENNIFENIKLFFDRLKNDEHFQEEYIEHVRKIYNTHRHYESYTLEYTLIFASEKGFEIPLDAAKKYYLLNKKQFSTAPRFAPAPYYHPSGVVIIYPYKSQNEKCYWDFNIKDS